MNVVAEITLESLRQHDVGSLERYGECLRNTFEAHPPPFSAAWYGDQFREMARNREWFANIIVGNASTEGWGSGKLWYLAGKTPDDAVSALIQQHAMDEARHSRMYQSMVERIFPGTVTEALRAEFKTLAPIYRFGDKPERLVPYTGQDILDNLLQMNVAEIRTLVNQLIARPVLMTYCPADARERLTRMLDRLMWDESRHVGYTARLIDDALATRDGDFIRDLAPTRIIQLNELTLEEVGRARANPQTAFA
ncbi:ferritin-like domain-containing protein [Pyxidicoccus parkwayensis]|uniref:Ferritin-like domain-containing protein n=1 Tax=Pyxidicoccus parkwayensis TaxID=2813578 RepID=A0ABX7NX42_9BACT|nr:ferritin-like domain-containing protein [Pyxidicoccus parkwaysis]QSQ23283.1 ferritin-like domain-containing protein [Pyxidicoccus parkwaysis]